MADCHALLFTYMSYRIYIQRAYTLARANPLLWLLGAVSSGAALGSMLVWAGVLLRSETSWTESLRMLNIPVWVLVLSILLLIALAALGRYAKTILLLHLVAQLRVKRVPQGFRRASDAAVVEPEDEALAGVMHQSLVRESKQSYFTVLAIHGVVSLLLLVALAALLYPPLFMTTNDLQIKLIITSVVGTLFLALLILFQGIFATLFVVLYRRSMKVAMNVAGDMLIMHIQTVFAVGLLAIVLLLASAVVFYGVLAGLLRVADLSWSFLALSIIGFLWIGIMQVFFSAIIVQLFADLVKPEAFESAIKPIKEEASSEL